MVNDEDLKTMVLTYIEGMQEQMRQLNQAIEQVDIDATRAAYDAIAASLEAVKAELDAA